MKNKTPFPSKYLLLSACFIYHLIAFPLFISSAKALQTSISSQDTLEFETQRQKVNDLLEERTQKYGQYEESLKKRTGIFGSKTKNDMQSSINILLKIVESDQKIFIETKRLISYKDQLLSFESFEKNKIQQIADEYDQRIDAYIKTISKLQREIELQKNDYQKLQRVASRNQLISLILSIFILGFVLFKYLRKGN